MRDDTTIEVFRARSLRPRWRFRVRNDNTQVTAQSSETYPSKGNAIRGAEAFRESMRGDVPIVVIEP